jgi:hypothetical protein
MQRPRRILELGPLPLALGIAAGIGSYTFRYARGLSYLSAQHPEFELWTQGIHARSSVSCADCHMPYMRQGRPKSVTTGCAARF